MTVLVACLGAGKGTWTGVLKLASREEFEQTFLIVNDWTKQTLKVDKPNIYPITINSEESTSKIRDSIVSQLKGKIKAFEVAVNIDSATGKEHTALITALMKLGLSFRFVVFENEKIEEVSFDLEVPKEDDY